MQEGFSSSCSFRVYRAGPEICQIRLDFASFSLSPPGSEVRTDSSPNSRTQCEEAQFSASSAGPAAPVLCGTNTGYHMILEASQDWNTLTASWSPERANNNYWNILISQIPCGEPWAPPPGCLQFFTGVTGQISSYNFQGGLHLANQLYTACIRQELNHCSINYAATDADFQVRGEGAGGDGGGGGGG